MNPTDFIQWALRGLAQEAENRPHLFEKQRDFYLRQARSQFGPESEIIEKIDETLPRSVEECLEKFAAVAG